MKKTLLTLTFFVSAIGLHGQNIFFPTKVGTILKFVQKEADGTIDGYTRQTITEVEGSGNNMTISYLYESMDENKKTVVEKPCKMVIENDVMIFDLKHFFVGQLKSSNEKIDDVTGTPLKFSNNLQPGQLVEDAHMIMAMHKSVVPVKVKLDMTNGKCVAIEDVKTQAGTFKGYKITQDVTSNVSIGKTTPTHVISWGVPGIGIVRIDTYDMNGNLQKITELIEIK
jgi:hypothetical protein